MRGRQEPATSQRQVCPSCRPHAREYWRYLEGQRVQIFSNGIDLLLPPGERRQVGGWEGGGDTQPDILK